MKTRKSYFNLSGSVSVIFAAVCLIMLLPVPESVAGNNASESLYVSLFSRHKEPSSLPPLRPDIPLSKGKLLVAGRSMEDPRFAETVILLIQYEKSGAMGVIINRPLEVKLSRALPGFEGFREKEDLLYWGGPVGFTQVAVLFTSKEKPEDSFHVFGHVYYSPSSMILQEMADSTERSRKYRIYAGYAGWAAGQLDYELLRGDWHIFQADAQTIFERNSSDIWKELIMFDTAEQVFFIPEKP